MTIRDIIIKYTDEFSKISDSPRLDIEVMLMKVLGDVDKLYLHMNLNKDLSQEILDEIEKMAEEKISENELIEASLIVLRED